MKKITRKRIIAYLLCLSFAVALLSGCGNDGGDAENASLNDSQNEKPDPQTSQAGSYMLSQAVYPEMAAYPNEMDYFNEEGEFDSEGFDLVFDAWQQGRDAQHSQTDGYQDGLNFFFESSLPYFLGGTDSENHIFSPLNVYMALGMLAEITDGNSRQQILDALGAPDIESLRSQANMMWNANYCKDGAVTSVLAGSLWLSDQIPFRQETLDSLADHYYASAYRGAMGSPEFDAALQSWLDEQTGGLLKEQADTIRMAPETIIALATTVYYQAKWSHPFSESATSEGVFHSADGDVTCDFMHQSGPRDYYWGSRFAAVSQHMEADGGNMWFFLPDEGVPVTELLTDKEVLSLFLTDSGQSGTNVNATYLIVNLSVPRFDAASHMDLCESMRSLGITDVFSTETSDFSPLTDSAGGIYLSKAEHAARVKIDEEGCTATAFTVMMAAGAAMPPEDEVDFVLDRPFFFVLTGMDGLPLFAGIVNQP